MDDGSPWNLAAVLIGGPLGVIAATLIVTLVRSWPAIMAKVNEARRDRADIRTNELERMDARMQRLEERCGVLEIEKEECRRELQEVRDQLAVERSERLRLGAIMQGQGEVRQRAAEVVAADRQAREIEDKGKKP
jgi:uncharacterized membrane protein